MLKIKYSKRLKIAYYNCFMYEILKKTGMYEMLNDSFESSSSYALEMGSITKYNALEKPMPLLEYEGFNQYPKIKDYYTSLDLLARMVTVCRVGIDERAANLLFDKFCKKANKLFKVVYRKYKKSKRENKKNER